MPLLVEKEIKCINSNQLSARNGMGFLVLSDYQMPKTRTILHQKCFDLKSLKKFGKDQKSDLVFP